MTFGPILPSTRRVYERKLFELETGQTAAPSSGYEPFSDDEEEGQEEDVMDEGNVDEEVTFQYSQPRQRTTKTTRKPSPRKPLHPTGMAHSSTRLKVQTLCPGPSHKDLLFLPVNKEACHCGSNCWPSSLSPGWSLSSSKTWRVTPPVTS